MGSDMRKHPRFSSEVPIRFGDKVTNGKMLNISQNGALIIIENKQEKKEGSFITFTAYLDGNLPPKKSASPEISVSRKLNQMNHPETAKDKKTTVKIAAKVMRVTELHGQPAMGIQFMDMEVEDLTTWLRFLGDVRSKQDVLPFGTASITNRNKIKKAPGFTIRFQDMDYVKTFLPEEPTGSFFIPTNRKTKKNRKVRVTLVHPTEDRLIQIDSVVKSSVDGEIDNTDKSGLLCSFASVSDHLIKEINHFLKERFYDSAA